MSATGDGKHQQHQILKNVEDSTTDKDDTTKKMDINEKSRETEENEEKVSNHQSFRSESTNKKMKRNRSPEEQDNSDITSPKQKRSNAVATGDGFSQEKQFGDGYVQSTLIPEPQSQEHTTATVHVETQDNNNTPRNSDDDESDENESDESDQVPDFDGLLLEPKGLEEWFDICDKNANEFNEWIKQGNHLKRFCFTIDEQTGNKLIEEIAIQGHVSFLSDIDQCPEKDEWLYQQVVNAVVAHNVNKTEFLSELKSVLKRNKKYEQEKDIWNTLLQKLSGK